MEASGARGDNRRREASPDVRVCCAICQEVRSRGIRLVQQRPPSSTCYNRVFSTSTLGECEFAILCKGTVFRPNARNEAIDGSSLPPAALLTSIVGSSRLVWACCGRRCWWTPYRCHAATCSTRRASQPWSKALVRNSVVPSAAQTYPQLSPRCVHIFLRDLGSFVTN
jgi:hypothetical protein